MIPRAAPPRSAGVSCAAGRVGRHRPADRRRGAGLVEQQPESRGCRRVRWGSSSPSRRRAFDRPPPPPCRGSAAPSAIRTIAPAAVSVVNGAPARAPARARPASPPRRGARASSKRADNLPRRSAPRSRAPGRFAAPAISASSGRARRFGRGDQAAARRARRRAERIGGEHRFAGGDVGGVIVDRHVLAVAAQTGAGEVQRQDHQTGVIDAERLGVRVGEARQSTSGRRRPPRRAARRPLWLAPASS